jgi:CPA1 family monovalent cation:H+ antiporter
MPLSETVLVLALLLATAVVVAALLRPVPVPDSVVLVVLGVGLGQASGLWGPLAPLAEFRLSPEVVFFIFLPALIFESGFNLDARQLVKDLVPVLVLAVPALVGSTLLVGVGLKLALGLDLSTALLFGALISATDPVAVVALFRELGAPLRLTVLVEGESLLNDATAIVVFSILLAMATGGGGFGLAEIGAGIVDFLRVFAGGALLGMVLGTVTTEVLYRLRCGTSAVLVMSMVVAYAGFSLAEHVLHVSGVMAAAGGALAMAALGVVRLPREATRAIGETWETLALVCNSLLFLLVGLSVDLGRLIERWPAIAAAIPLVLLARALAVYGLLPVTVRFFRLPRVTRGERHVMWWGGLKGGLAIAIALSVPATLPGRDLLLDLTLGVVLFTLVVNASTVRPLMAWLGLDRMSAEERAELHEALVAARGEAGSILEDLESAGVLDRDTRQTLEASVAESLAPGADDETGDRAAHDAHRAALAAETRTLDRLYGIGFLTQYTYLDLRSLVRRDREQRDGAGGRNPFLILETALLRALREHDWAARLLAWYQNIRLTQHLEHNVAGVLMAEAAQGALRARRDLPREAVGPLAALYEDRRARRLARIAAVRNEFPKFYERFEARWSGRAALRSALRRAHKDHHQGEIGTKALTDIDRRIQAALERLPGLVRPRSTLNPVEFLGQVPMFSGLTAEALRALARQARVVTFLPGDVVVGEGERGDALYVITHGQAEVRRQGGGGDDAHLASLCPGDFFGEGALLGDQVRSATVRAQVPTTSLRLTRRDVLSVSRRDPDVERCLRAADEARRAEQPTSP